MNKVVLGFVFGLVGSMSAHSSWAANEPPCMDQGHDISVNNSDVMHWKTSTPNQFMARAHVTGVVSKLYPNRNGHNHFQMLVDDRAGDTLEVVYNVHFGALGEVKEGMSVEACGDYITSNAPTAQYEPSPDGAIIHWVHQAKRRRAKGGAARGHESGYLEINETVFGQLNR